VWDLPCCLSVRPSVCACPLIIEAQEASTFHLPDCVYPLNFVFYTVRVVSKESRRLILPRISCCLFERRSQARMAPCFTLEWAEIKNVKLLAFRQFNFVFITSQAEDCKETQQYHSAKFIVLVKLHYFQTSGELYVRVAQVFNDLISFPEAGFQPWRHLINFIFGSFYLKLCPVQW
jgi:hypothetical protein